MYSIRHKFGVQNLVTNIYTYTHIYIESGALWERGYMKRSFQNTRTRATSNRIILLADCLPAPGCLSAYSSLHDWTIHG